LRQKRHRKLKIAFRINAMRHFAQAPRREGIQVDWNAPAFYARPE